MAQKKSTAPKATAPTKEEAKKAAESKPAPKPKPASKPKPAPKANQPAPAVTQTGLYSIKSERGASNLKGMPLPGKRVLLILPNSSCVVNDLEIVGEGKSFVLR